MTCGLLPNCLAMPDLPPQTCELAACNRSHATHDAHANAQRRWAVPAHIAPHRSSGLAPVAGHAQPALPGRAAKQRLAHAEWRPAFCGRTGPTTMPGMSWLRPREAGAPVACLSANHASGYPGLLPASATQPLGLGWPATSGHLGPVFDIGPPTRLHGTAARAAVGAVRAD